MEPYELRVPQMIEYKEIYEWKINETNMHHFTCRPIKELAGFEEYYSNILKWADVEGNNIHVLVNSETKSILGEIKSFDLNPRNYSVEIGFYLPKKNRSQGFGHIMLKKFVNTLFIKKELSLNKIYATTSSINLSSINLLLKSGFSLDGKNREHFWIDGNRYEQHSYSILKSEWLEIYK